MKKTVKKMFTESEIKLVLKLWDDKTTTQIAEELGRSASSIPYIAAQIRKAGYDLPKKESKGSLRFMVKKVLKEMKLID